MYDLLYREIVCKHIMVAVNGDVLMDSPEMLYK